MKSTSKVLYVIVATLVGAGFASGKEIYSFFFVYGTKGIFGIIISGALISWVAYKVLMLCYVNGISTFQEFCNYLIGRCFPGKVCGAVNEISGVINGVMNVILLITFYIMISGFSSFLYQEFYVGRVVGSIVIIFLCYVAFKRNVDGLVKISNYLIPVLIIFLVFISVKNVDFIENYNSIKYVFVESGWVVPVVKAVLYGSYNCILLVPVIVALNGVISGKRASLMVGVATFVTIVVLSFSVYNILLLGDVQTFALEMPIIQIVKRYGGLCRLVYVVMIAISIYTTAISTGCGFLNGSSKSRFGRNLVLMCASAVVLSQISFSTFIELLYPVLGVIGFVEVVAIFRA